MLSTSIVLIKTEHKTFNVTEGFNDPYTGKFMIPQVDEDGQLRHMSGLFNIEEVLKQPGAEFLTREAIVI